MKNYKFENNCFNSNLSSILLSVTLLLVLVLVQSSLAGIQPVMNEQLEQVILAEDWGKVVELLGGANDPNLPAVQRLIKAHACLATNRNNESLCLFLGASSQNDLQEWQTWSQDFAAKYPGSSIAYYFTGDSAARLEQWDQAITDFNIALKIAPNHPLVLNARGVTYARLKELTKARLDFAEAINHSNSSLADAYANIGALRIQKKDGGEGALAAFNKALERSPNFALALHGRACVEMVLDRSADAKNDFQTVEQLGACSSVAKWLFSNRIRIAAFWSGMEENTFLAMIESGKNTGTTFDSQIGNISHEQFKQSFQGYTQGGYKSPGVLSQWDFNKNVAKPFSRLSPQDQKIVMNKIIAPALRDNLKVKNSFDGHLKEYGKYNQDFGPADGFNNALIVGGTGTATFAPHPIGKAVGVGSAYAGAKLDEVRDNHFNNSQIMRRLYNESIGSVRNPCGGVDMNLVNILWDGGNWPFVGYYGLAYGAKNSELSSSQEAILAAKQQESNSPDKFRFTGQITEKLGNEKRNENESGK